MRTCCRSGRGSRCGLGTASGFSGKKEDKEIYYSYASYIYPSTIFKYDINSGKSSIYKKPGIKFDPAKFESKQVFYTSPDGTQIPMIITYKKGVQLNGKNPCLLYAYGGFSVSLTPSFSTSSIILLENGGVYAVWSAWEDRKFEQRLRWAGFTVTMHRMRARLKRGGPKHTIFVGTKST